MMDCAPPVCHRGPCIPRRNTSVHGQQAVFVRMCRILDRGFDAHADRRVEIHWIPSHTGTLQNELIDAHVKEVAVPYDTNLRSYLTLRAAAKADALDSWRQTAPIQNPPTHSQRHAP